MRGFLKKSPKTKAEKAKEWSFIFNALAFSMIVTAIIITFAPYADYNNPQIDEIRSVEASLTKVYPRDVPSLLLSESKAAPSMLVLYASWCGYCARLMPSIFELMEEDGLSNAQPVFVAMDAQPRIFSKYLVRTGYHHHFKPVMLKEVLYNNLPNVMSEKTGSHFNGSIPYVGFFSPEGKMVAEVAGLVDKQTLRDMAASAAKAVQPR